MKDQITTPIKTIKKEVCEKHKPLKCDTVRDYLIINVLVMRKEKQIRCPDCGRYYFAMEFE